MWSRCSPNSIHRLAYSAGGSFPGASTPLLRIMAIDALVAACSASEEVALTLVYLFCLTELMLPDHWNSLLSAFHSRRHLLPFSCETLGPLLSACLWLNGSRLCLLSPVVCPFFLQDVFSVTNSVSLWLSDIFFSCSAASVGDEMRLSLS